MLPFIDTDTNFSEDENSLEMESKMLKELLLNPDLSWMQVSSNPQCCVTKEKVPISGISQKQCQCLQRKMNGKMETNKRTAKRQSRNKVFKVKNELVLS